MFSQKKPVLMEWLWHEPHGLPSSKAHLGIHGYVYFEKFSSNSYPLSQIKGRGKDKKRQGLRDPAFF
jgi:hypothetical protein